MPDQNKRGYEETSIEDITGRLTAFKWKLEHGKKISEEEKKEIAHLSELLAIKEEEKQKLLRLEQENASKGDEISAAGQASQLSEKIPTDVWKSEAKVDTRNASVQLHGEHTLKVTKDLFEGLGFSPEVINEGNYLPFARFLDGAKCTPGPEIKKKGLEIILQEDPAERKQWIAEVDKLENLKSEAKIDIIRNIFDMADIGTEFPLVNTRNISYFFGFIAGLTEGQLRNREFVKEGLLGVIKTLKECGEISQDIKNLKPSANDIEGYRNLLGVKGIPLDITNFVVEGNYSLIVQEAERELKALDISKLTPEQKKANEQAILMHIIELYTPEEVWKAHREEALKGRDPLEGVPAISGEKPATKVSLESKLEDGKLEVVGERSVRAGLDTERVTKITGQLDSIEGQIESIRQVSGILQKIDVRDKEALTNGLLQGYSILTGRTTFILEILKQLSGVVRSIKGLQDDEVELREYAHGIKADGQAVRGMAEDVKRRMDGTDKNINALSAVLNEVVVAELGNKTDAEIVGAMEQKPLSKYMSKQIAQALAEYGKKVDEQFKGTAEILSQLTSAGYVTNPKLEEKLKGLQTKSGNAVTSQELDKEIKDVISMVSAAGYITSIKLEDRLKGLQTKSAGGVTQKELEEGLNAFIKLVKSEGYVTNPKLEEKLKGLDERLKGVADVLSAMKVTAAKEIEELLKNHLNIVYKRLTDIDPDRRQGKEALVTAGDLEQRLGDLGKRVAETQPTKYVTPEELDERLGEIKVTGIDPSKVDKVIRESVKRTIKKVMRDVDLNGVQSKRIQDYVETYARGAIREELSKRKTKDEDLPAVVQKGLYKALEDKKIQNIIMSIVLQNYEPPKSITPDEVKGIVQKGMEETLSKVTAGYAPLNELENKLRELQTKSADEARKIVQKNIEDTLASPELQAKVLDTVKQNYTPPKSITTDEVNELIQKGVSAAGYATEKALNEKLSGLQTKYNEEARENGEKIITNAINCPGLQNKILEVIAQNPRPFTDEQVTALRDKVVLMTLDHLRNTGIDAAVVKSVANAIGKEMQGITSIRDNVKTFYDGVQNAYKNMRDIQKDVMDAAANQTKNYQKDLLLALDGQKQLGAAAEQNAKDAVRELTLAEERALNAADVKLNALLSEGKKDLEEAKRYANEAKNSSIASKLGWKKAALIGAGLAAAAFAGGIYVAGRVNPKNSEVRYLDDNDVPDIYHPGAGVMLNGRHFVPDSDWLREKAKDPSTFYPPGRAPQVPINPQVSQSPIRRR